jgi:hypothetical protein
MLLLLLLDAAAATAAAAAIFSDVEPPGLLCSKTHTLLQGMPATASCCS